MKRLSVICGHFSVSQIHVQKVRVKQSVQLLSTLTPNYDRFLTATARRLKPSPIRALQPLTRVPGMISLGGGYPASSLFPFSDFSFKANGETLTLSATELGEALQYSPTQGLPKFVEWLSALQQREHNPPRKDWSIVVTAGSQDALSKAFAVLIGPQDDVLVDEPSYSGSLASLRPLGCHLHGIASDGDALIPEALEKKIQELTRAGRKPKVLYTIPNGQNPTGTSLTLQRKKEIYRIACQYDLIILEDDPHLWISYGPNKAPALDSDFRPPCVPSFFSMDIQGRVLRFDSFSKVLSSGIRLGFVTGPTILVDKINQLQQATSLHASGISQAIAFKYLQSVGEHGWSEHRHKVALFYARRRDAFIGYCEKHLTGLAEWSIPTAGLTVWLRLLGIDDSKTLIEEKAMKAKVLLVPGQAFSPSGAVSSYVRASFSLPTDEQMDVALSRLAALLREHVNSQRQS